MTRPPLWCLLLFAVAGCQVDLRPSPLDEREAPLSEARGRELLVAAGAVLELDPQRPYAQRGGIDVEFEDEWFGLVGAFACPWPDDPQRLRFRFTPTRESGALELVGAETRWGIHDWNTWREEPGEARAYTDDDDDVWFWLPTLQYFLEAPFRLREAGVVDYAGERDEGGRTYALVYFSWGSYLPQDAIDQYLAWIDRETGRLDRLEFTVRDVADFVTGCAFYSDYREVDGLVLPHRIQIGSDPLDPTDLLHDMTVQVWRAGVELPRDAYVLDPPRAPRAKHRD